MDELRGMNVASFFGKYKFGSAGAGSKNQKKICKRKWPSVTHVKPRMPKSWGKDGNPRQSAYCRVQLLKFKAFDHAFLGMDPIGKDEIADYLKEHDGDWVKAYAAFANSACGPRVAQDDFRSDFVYTEDGVVMDPEHNVQDPAFRVFSHQGRVGDQPNKNEVKQQVIPEFDWVSSNALKYTETQRYDAGTWQSKVKASAQRAPAVEVDTSQLNPAQAFPYRVVKEHYEMHRRREKQAPLRMMICGTSGAGKTFLIRALKQLLGDLCYVGAPTGVAADNIGGTTYHTVLPMPMFDIDRANIDLKDGPRLKTLESDWRHVRYLLLDEMSMVGRRALGQIDARLRQATGKKKRCLARSVSYWLVILGSCHQSKIRLLIIGRMCDTPILESSIPMEGTN
jgi:hypothetical protein